MNFKQVINIGSSTIGNDHPAYIVAEIGINHNGDINLAKEAIKAAKAAGVDAVKFQNYQTEDFISDKNLTYEYLSQGKKIVESQFEMFKRCELSQDDLIELINYCKEINIDIHSTPTNEQGVKLLAELGVSVLKNGSDYLAHLPLIRAMGETGLPTVLSTGMATLGEIDDAVRVFKETGNEQLVLLHCTSSYPTKAEDVHLNKITSFKSAFNTLVGLSDHTYGVVSAILSTYFGVCWIEKHFTLDKSLAGPDHHFSADPIEMSELVKSVRFAEKALGSSVIEPTHAEAYSRTNFRLSCISAKPLDVGHVLTKNDIRFQRPGTGFLPKEAKLILGIKLKRAIKAGYIFTRKDFYE